MRASHPRFVISLLVGVLVFASAFVFAVSPIAAGPAGATVSASDDVPQVEADDERDLYAGTGGLVLPRGSADEETRRYVAQCPGCRWRLRPPCADDGGPCLSVSRGCPRGRLLRSWSSRDGGRTWVDLGVACYPASGPVTIAEATELVRERVEEAVPGSSITRQPYRGVVPHLPVSFQSGQPAALPPIRMALAGREVEVVPVASWRWRFGDGSELATSLPGAPYPDLTVSHAYRRAGRYPVLVETTWAATYLVDGLGPFALDPIRQRAEAVVVVAPALAALVPGG